MGAFSRAQEIKRAYDMVFGASGSAAVLADLAKFCRADETTFHADARIHAVLEGRREVWLRIQRHLNMTPTELLEHWNPEVKDVDHAAME
jgi:hypothetical protein